MTTIQDLVADVRRRVYGSMTENINLAQTSADQSKALRKNYAGVGYTFDEERDAFIPPQPFESWLLDEESCLWEAPVAYPTDGEMYAWDEATLTWIETL